MLTYRLMQNNKVYYLEVVQSLLAETYRTVEKQIAVLLHYNAPAHTLMLVRELVDKTKP